MNRQLVFLGHLPSGGNADVQLMQHPDTAALVVVKFLREWHLDRARKAFEREVRILKQNLPGMIPIMDANLQAQRPYYVMPYLPGGSITKHARRLSESQFLAVADQAARSLAALHNQHIAHGDFKPDNILITQEGNLQLADPLGNGIGCTVLFSQNSGGTPGYWAPEIRLHRRPISKAGDSYSYGATLFHLYTGSKPQDGQRLDLLVQSYTRIPKITEIIAACCDADPDSRPSMKEVLRMLAGATWSDLQVERRQQRLVGGCAIAALVLLGFAAAR